MGGNWSRDTALKPDTVDQHTRKIKREFDQLINNYDANARADFDTITFHVYTYTKPFHCVERPLDRHKVVNFTLDHQNFVTVDLRKHFTRRNIDGHRNYTIYPECRHIRLSEEKTKRLEYVGSKQYSRENLSSAPYFFANTAVQTMLKFGGYNFLVNNCQDYVDIFLRNIGLDEFNNENERRNVVDRHPNYFTDLGRFLKKFYDSVWKVSITVATLYVFLPRVAGRGVPKSDHIPTGFKYMFMVLVVLICLVFATAILRGLVKRSVREGYDIFAYYLSNSNVLSLTTLIMICVMYIYKGEKELFLFWYVCFGQWVNTLAGTSGVSYLGKLDQILAVIASVQTINTIFFEYLYFSSDSSHGSLFGWNKNPAIWILIVFPKQLSTTRCTTMQLAGDMFFSVFVTLLPVLYTLVHSDNVTKMANSGFSTVFFLYYNTAITYPRCALRFIWSLIPDRWYISAYWSLFIGVIPTILIGFLYALPLIHGLCYYVVDTTRGSLIALATEDRYKLLLANDLDWCLCAGLRLIFGEFGEQRHPWLHGIPILNQEIPVISKLQTAFLPFIDRTYVQNVVFAVVYSYKGITANRLVILSLIDATSKSLQEFFMIILMVWSCVYSMIKFKDPSAKIRRPLNKEATKLILSLTVFFTIFMWYIVVVEDKMKIAYFLGYICMHAYGIYMKIY